MFLLINIALFYYPSNVTSIALYTKICRNRNMSKTKKCNSNGFYSQGIKFLKKSYSFGTYRYYFG